MNPTRLKECQFDARDVALVIWLTEKLFLPAVTSFEAMGMDYAETISFSFVDKEGMRHTITQGITNIADFKRALEQSLEALRQGGQP